MTIQAGPCRWCGEQHDGQGMYCPVVKALELDPVSGIVTRVEFLTPADMHPRQRIESAEPEADYPKLGPNDAQDRDRHGS